MGVNTIILLPADVRLRDAADVIGILAGLRFEKQMLGSDGAYGVRVDGIKCEPTSVPEMAAISINRTAVDGEKGHYATWHFESDHGTGERLLYPRSTAFWIAVGRKLIDFFGGSIVYNDCGNHKPDYKRPAPRLSNCPNHGLPWQHFQDEKLRVIPLTERDIEDADELAAYKLTKSTP